MPIKVLHSYFKNIEVKYVDNKYIYIPAIVFFCINLFAASYISAIYSFILAISLLLLILLLTVFHLYRKTTLDLEDERRQTQALISIHSLIDIKSPLPSMTEWSAKPDLANVIIEFNQFIKPDFILEAGSGVSSIISCYCIEKNGHGKHLALDHNESYANSTYRQLEKHDLLGFGEVIHAPLIDYQINDENWKWYDLSKVKIPSKIDVLIIDGPPVSTQKQARFPALPLLYQHLSDKAVIILDDARRKSEQKVIQRWLELYPEFTLELRPSKKGIAVLIRNISRSLP